MSQALGPLPAVVAHADWSVGPAKRWIVRAALAADGRYRAGPPEPVGPPETLLERLRDPAEVEGPLLLGLDLPLGLPLAYARRAGIEDFGAWLAGLGRGRWRALFEVAERPEEIALTRPFYPKRPGGAREAHLIQGLGLADRAALYRRCDRATGERLPASPIFWTLGPQQVGKAALSCWRELLVPARRAGAVRLWPFDGPLAALLAAGGAVAAETYPGEVYGHLGVAFRGPDGRRGRKGDRAARQANAGLLTAQAEALEVALAPALRRAIEAGFTAAEGDDDGFDALVGLLGLVNVLRGRRPPGEPADPEVRRIEGWILGQAAPD